MKRALLLFFILTLSYSVDAIVGVQFVKVYTDPTVKYWEVYNLPSGLAYYSSPGKLEIRGTPIAPGRYALEVLKYSNSGLIDKIKGDCSNEQDDFCITVYDHIRIFPSSSSFSLIPGSSERYLPDLHVSKDSDGVGCSCSGQYSFTAIGGKSLSCTWIEPIVTPAPCLRMDTNNNLLVFFGGPTLNYCSPPKLGTFNVTVKCEDQDLGFSEISVGNYKVPVILNKNNTILGFSQGDFNIYNSKFKDLFIILLLISVSLISIAVMLGYGFNISSVISWLKLESKYLIENIILIILLFGFVSWYNNSFSFSNPIDEVIKWGQSNAKEVFLEGMEAARLAYMRQTTSGTSLIILPFLQFSKTIGPNAYLQIEFEMLQHLFKDYNNIFIVLLGVKYFLNYAPYIGSLFLIFGLLARNFFATRNMGSTFVAIGFAILYVFPALLSINYSLIKTEVYSESVYSSSSSCPALCNQQSPAAFKQSGDVIIKLSYYDLMESMDSKIAKELYNGSIKEYSPVSDLRFVSCEYLAKEIDPENPCPNKCRTIPLLADPDCEQYQDQCYALTENCKKILVDTEPYSIDMCVPPCETITPLRNDCSACDDVPFACRAVYRQGNSVTKEPIAGCEQYKSALADCPASLNPFESCVYVVPEESKSCDELCSGCPQPFRVYGEDVNLPSGYAACSSCPLSCKINPQEAEKQIYICNLPEIKEACSSCPAYCRTIGNDGSVAPEDLCQGCINCPLECREFKVPIYSCELCNNADKKDKETPPILDCATCRGSIPEYFSNENNIQENNSASEAYNSMVGRTEIKLLSMFYFYGYAVVTLSIALTIIFIKGFSEFLGGEIFIPGLEKVL